MYASRVPLLADWRSTGVKLGLEEKEQAFLASFQVRPILIDRILEAQGNSEEVQELIFAISKGKKKDLRVRETDVMLMQDKRMYMSNIEELKKEILDEAHISAYAMHPGGTKMYHTIRPFYYWPGMKREIVEYVSMCAVCQQVKAERKKRFGLMQPLPVPQWKWENITMDFVYKLPRTRNGYDGVWVIVDRLTKSGHFIPVREKYSLNKLAELFLLKIVKYHGVPVSIISNRDPRFTSKFWKAFQEAFGAELLYSTVYHSQTDGQSERTIQTLEDMLRSSVLQFGDDWHAKLDLMEFTYNNSYHSRIGIAPFEALYRLELPSELSKVHNVFHVSMLRHYVSDPLHVIPPQALEISPDLTYEEEPVTILDWKDKVLRNKTIRMVKVLWRNHSVEEAT